jgi:hypothetical protein
MILKRYSVLAIGLVVFSGTGTVCAAPDVTLRGFGTLGATHNFSDGAAPIRDIGQPDGPRDGTSFDMDSRLGIQLDTEFTREISSAVQVVTSYNYEGKYTPRLNRAFFKYDFSAQGVQVRLGRFGWDIYSLSDSRNVGYALLWVRPPVDYFGKLQEDSLDGADLTFSHQLGEGVVGGKAYWGQASEKVAIDSSSYLDLSGTEIYGGHLEYQYNDWNLRFSAAWSTAETELRGHYADLIEDILNSGDPELIETLIGSGASNLSVKSRTLSTSLIYDSGPLLFQFMLGEDAFQNHLADSTLRGFFTFSYRLGDLKPYVTVAFAETNPTLENPAPSLANMIFEDQYSYSAGVRYDFHENIALKVQADHFEVSRGGRNAITWREVQPDWNGRINQLSVTLDFIF